MTELHSIMPPPDLVQKWKREANHNEPMFPQVAAMAAQWGADQELQLCLDWFQEFCKDETWVHKDLKTFMAARRPKPLSLKEQALEAAQRFYAKGHEDCTDEEVKNDFDIILRALEALPD